MHLLEMLGPAQRLSDDIALAYDELRHHFRAELSGKIGRLGMTNTDVVHLARIDSYARTSNSGDRSGLAEVPEDSTVWPLVTSTRENCLGGECPHYAKCFVLEARKKAMDADVVVINHHLFFADLVLRDEGVGELLPAANTVIFDEAHQLPETASMFFGEHVSTSQLLELGRDVRVELAAQAGDATDVQEQASATEKTARDLRLLFARDATRKSFDEVIANAAFVAALDRAHAQLQRLRDLLEMHAGRSEGLHNCWQRTCELLDTLQRWRDEDDVERVRWVETYASSLRLNATPLSVADIFRNQIGSHPKAWIFTSATLSVAHRGRSGDRLRGRRRRPRRGLDHRFADARRLHDRQARGRRA